MKDKFITALYVAGIVLFIMAVSYIGASMQQYVIREAVIDALEQRELIHGR